jgi:hypothetical protein
MLKMVRKNIVRSVVLFAGLGVTEAVPLGSRFGRGKQGNPSIAPITSLFG